MYCGVWEERKIKISYRNFTKLAEWERSNEHWLLTCFGALSRWLWWQMDLKFSEFLLTCHASFIKYILTVNLFIYLFLDRLCNWISLFQHQIWKDGLEGNVKSEVYLLEVRSPMSQKNLPCRPCPPPWRWL